MVVEMDGYAGTGVAVKLSRTPGSAKTAPPAFGAQGRQILKEHGFDDSEIESFIRDHVMWEQPK